MNQLSKESAIILNIFVTRTVGAWAVLSGMLIALSGVTRWHTNAYHTLNYMPGSPYTWGVLFIIAGILTIMGSITHVHLGKITLRNIGLWLIAFWCLVFVIGFITAAIQSTVSFNIPSTYFVLGVISIFMTKSRFTT